MPTKQPFLVVPFESDLKLWDDVVLVSTNKVAYLTRFDWKITKEKKYKDRCKFYNSRSKGHPQNNFSAEAWRPNLQVPNFEKENKGNTKMLALWRFI